MMLFNTIRFSPVVTDGIPDFPKHSYEWLQWWNIQRERCLNGYTADGVRITGPHYFYLNFWKITSTSKTADNSKGKRKGLNRPRFTILDYEFFHEVEKARILGKHMCVTKRRQSGFSEKAAALAAVEFLFYRNSQTLIVGGEYEYPEDTMRKVHRGLNTLTDTEFYKRMNPNTIEFSMARFKGTGDKDFRGFMSELHTLTCKNNSQATIGKSFGKGTKVIMFDGSFKNVEDIKPLDILMGPDSKPRIVQTIHSGKETLYKIHQKKGIDYVVNESHLMYFHAKKNKALDPFKNKFSKQHDSSHLIIPMKDFVNQSGIFKRACMAEKSKLIEFKPKEIGFIDPYFIGLWLGDGDNDRLQITSIDKEIIDYVHSFANKHGYKVSCKEGDIRYYITNSESYKRKNRNGNKLKDWFNDHKLFHNKHIPDLYLKNCEITRLSILAGIIDSDGHKCKSSNFYEISTTVKTFAYDIEFLCRSLGFSVTIKESRSKLYGKYCGEKFRIFVSGDLHTIPVKVERKKFHKKHIYNTGKCFNRYGITYENIGIGEYYGFTVNSDHLFLLEDFTIVHNTPSFIIFEEAGKFPNLIESFNYIKPALETEGETTSFALIFGTGGEMGKGADQLMKIFYQPSVYNMMEYDDIYSEDYNAEDPNRKKVGYFVPAWRYLKIDDDGNDLYDESIEFLLNKRELTKTAKESKTFFNEITQFPIYSEEAFLIGDGNVFDSQKINKRLAVVRRNKMYEPRRIRLDWIKSGKEFVGVNAVDDDTGDFLIFEEPQKEEGKAYPPDFLYKAGTDSYDRDQAVGKPSLGSCVMMKGFWKASQTSRKPVARLTYRPDTAEEFYESTAKLCMYYNALNLIEYSNIGIFTWYKNNNLSYLLRERPEIAYANIKDSKMQNKWGIDPQTKHEWINALSDYIQNNIDNIDDTDMLTQLAKYRSDPKYNCDITISTALAVIHMNDDVDYEVREEKEKSLAKFRIGYKFENGKLTRKIS